MNTKALRQKILDLAIHGKLVPQDPNDEPASVLLERIRGEKERLINEGKIKRPKKTKTTSDKPHYPYELPAGWAWTTLGEICCIKGGKRIPRGMTFAKGKTAHVYIRVTDMKDNTIKLSDLKYIDDYVYEHIKNYTINASDLYLTIAGTIGSVGIVPNEVDGMNLTENAAKLTQIGCIKEYLLYALLSTIAQEHFISRFHQVAQPKLSIETASKTPIAMPPIGEQNRIVKEIKRYLAAIKIIEEGQTDLETTISQAKSKILDLAIHGKLVPQDPTDEPAAKLLKRINPKAEIACDNGHYQKLPEGWAVCTLKNVCKVITGSTPSKSNPIYYGGNIPFYKPADLDFGRYVKNASEYLSEEGMCVSRVVPAGSTAVCCIGTIGKVGYLVNAGTTNQQINCAIPSKAVYDVFLFYLCSSSWFYNNLIKKSSAVTISIVNKSKMENIEIPLPPLEEQHRIVAKIEEIYAQLDAIEASL